MAIKSTITGAGNSSEALVTSRGQLVVAPLEYSSFYSVTADVINTAYNLIKPIPGRQFVITTIVLYANKNVGAGDASVVLYEATSATTTTVSKSIFTQEMVKQTTLSLTNLNIILTEGVWLNVKTNDDDVFANIAGYYVDAM